MEARLKVSSSPHIRSNDTTQKIMRDVAIALLPAAAYGVYNFGVNALIVLIVSVASAMLTEYAVQKIRKVPVTVTDFSAVVTGLLLGMNLPSTVPFWIPVVGSVFAIGIVKQAFGGLGHNWMNPALAARAMLVASWPVQMTTWAAVKADAVTTATPLGIIKEGLDVQLPSMTEALMGNIGGCIGETSALLLLLGGAYLVYRQVISIRIPLIYIGTVAVLTFLLGGFDLQYTLFSVLAGGLILGAVFMATDYASSPITAKGQVIYAVGCGLLTTIIRLYGGYPEGVSYSILLMNVAAPLIDKYTQPRVFGGAK
ncbi:RnfABCDGE type electron transport complex subunit D [Fusibacter ferrireducens]|uniref:Ion-translocating oxidoreductase complex subunit D n=1 Tax=Fusibacter ferrireducens TaxID=2785058 RepID=A0ABR9ZWN1_9FIRM|nr:RnfABCDGE type electron transport complex subunit D [Fusibacter ferrireducens]MBF4694856.1 RnfABCDGE type electron transport complex subunit D [Fusibacter ferrireducens]